MTREERIRSRERNNAKSQLSKAPEKTETQKAKGSTTQRNQADVDMTSANNSKKDSRHKKGGGSNKGGSSSQSKNTS